MIGGRVTGGGGVAANEKYAHLAMIPFATPTTAHLEPHRHEAGSKVNVLLTARAFPRFRRLVREHDAHALRATPAPLSCQSNSNESVTFLLKELDACAPCLLPTDSKSLVLAARVQMFS